MIDFNLSFKVVFLAVIKAAGMAVCQLVIAIFGGAVLLIVLASQPIWPWVDKRMNRRKAAEAA